MQRFATGEIQGIRIRYVHYSSEVQVNDRDIMKQFCQRPCADFHSDYLPSSMDEGSRSETEDSGAPTERGDHISAEPTILLYLYSRLAPASIATILRVAIMKDVPFSELEIKEQCKSYRDAKLGGLTMRNFVVLKKDGIDSQYAVKMAWARDIVGLNPLQSELDWMHHLKAHHDSKKVTFPTGYGIIKDGIWGLLVMQNLPGPTIWEEMGEGEYPLSDKTANDIAAVLQELRENTKLRDNLPSPTALTPSGCWNPQGHIFPPDGEGGRLLDDRLDYQEFMSYRMKEASCNESIIPLTESIFTHGDISPHNIKRLPNGSLGLYDFEMSFFGPGWSEAYALYAADEESKYGEPLMKALIRCGMGIDEDTRRELDNFRFWFAKLGGAVAREERELGMKY
ncbi:hypothetical protein K439DRAFT_809994 [Ramaria rubella]|nr:hypothetical protein K439DRAFT_809994 [Ramaria rubella]